ncbi:protein RRNAD1 isoform X3 [Cephus cinctus]|uniref:Protein RRNAD1 isoform X3 n=1 Tax=Cephus cinctus TaxID=211228 RepID=A0AAJ7BGS8_CEPCN|nr:protein RRNAD1 isoform X3 [Cephus cinctus]
MATTDVHECACGVCRGSRVALQQILRLLDVYGWLLDSYVVDFFQENLWDKLPIEWRHIMEVVTPEELGSWLLGESQSKRSWPLTLLALRKCIWSFGINRDHVNPKIIQCRNGLNLRKVVNPDRISMEKNESNTRSSNGCNSRETLLKLQNHFTKHVKMKKRHEIEKIAQIATDCASAADSERIVDVGAGMGHLARVLAYKYGLCVLCIEQQESLSRRARECDGEFFITVRKSLPDFKGKKPEHVTLEVNTSSDTRTKLPDCLHPCGDLAATLLRLYSEQENIKFICIVGCCYMKLTLEETEEKPRGYPLSRYLSQLKNNSLSYTALEVGCHAIESYCDKLKTGKIEDLIVHAYRAALESILVAKNEKLRHAHLKSVKVTRGITFECYCKMATANLPSEYQPNDSDFKKPCVTEFLKSWWRAVAFSSLRFMLAPLVETVVLLDRFLFLSEKNLAPTLTPIFDPRLSPRNFVLTSIK